MIVKYNNINNVTFYYYHEFLNFETMLPTNLVIHLTLFSNQIEMGCKKYSGA